MRQLSNEFEVADENGLFRMCATPRRVRRIGSVCVAMGFAAILIGLLADEYLYFPQYRQRALPRIGFYTTFSFVGACFAWGIAVWLSANQRRCLTIDTGSGIVRLGNCQLFDFESIAFISLVEDVPLDPHGDVTIRLEFTRHDGSTIAMPTSFLSNLPDWATAMAAGRVLADRMRVEIRGLPLDLSFLAADVSSRRDRVDEEIS